MAVLPAAASHLRPRGPGPVAAGRHRRRSSRRRDAGRAGREPAAQLRLAGADAAAPAARRRGRAWRRCSAILLGGAATADGLLAEARGRGRRVVTTYGMSETCGGCVYDGDPLDGVSVRIGADGRIMDRRARAVLRLPAAAGPHRGCPRTDGWFVTVRPRRRVDADGRLLVRGRADDVIISGGEKVVAERGRARCSAAARACAEAVVVGRPDADWGEPVTALSWCRG